MAKDARATSEPCDDCGYSMPLHWTVCPHCGRPSRFPNVRYAAQQAEVEVLEERYRQAKTDAEERGVASTLTQFETAVECSGAVIACPLTKVVPMATGDRQLYANAYDLERLRFPRAQLDPTDPDWDYLRPIVETALFGKDNFANIHYAALSLEAEGLPHYGNCSVVLSSPMIAHRATAFEENSLVFVIQSDIRLGSAEFPKGVRSSWERRHQLCVAKLANAITPTTTHEDFAHLLLHSGTKAIHDQFVEVHVFGPMTLCTMAILTIRRDSPEWDIHIDAIKDMKSLASDVEIRVIQ